MGELFDGNKDEVYDPFAAYNEDMSDEQKMKSSLIQQIQDAAELWPEFLAMFKGMVQAAIEDGWEEVAARTLVLSTVTGALNTNVMANLPSGDSDGSLGWT